MSNVLQNRILSVNMGVRIYFVSISSFMSMNCLLAS